MIHIGQNIIDVLGSSLVWGLLAVFTAQTDLADQPTVTHGKDLSSSSSSGKDTMDMAKIQGMYKDMASGEAYVFLSHNSLKTDLLIPLIPRLFNGERENEGQFEGKEND